MVRVHHRPLWKARLGGLLSFCAAGAAALLASAPPAAAQDVAIRKVGTFSSPTYVTAPPGDRSRLFVVQRRGVVRVVRRGRTLRRPFLDLRDEVLIRSGSENTDQRGMLSLAFAPDYARSGRFVVFYVDRQDRIRVEEFRGRARTRRPLLVIPDAGPMHHGGQLAYAPDGLLYVGVGYGDDEAAPQDPANLRGKILRLDPDGVDPRPEVYALGLRNPYRFSFDEQTRSLLVADVGGDDQEEMTRLPTGGMSPPFNLGWSVFEGTQRLAPGEPANLVAPTLTHRHSSRWCSIVGGYVARDRTLPAGVRGRYVYGDVCSGRIHAARLDGSGRRRLRIGVPYLVSFGLDGRRRLYAVSLDGGVWRVVRARRRPH